MVLLNPLRFSRVFSPQGAWLSIATQQSSRDGDGEQKQREVRERETKESEIATTEENAEKAAFPFSVVCQHSCDGLMKASQFGQ